MEILVFRHGETDWNQAQKLQGHTDIPLNQKGQQQALELAQKLLNQDIEIILSSDLSRAKETAEIVSLTCDIPIILTEHLRECGLGELEGMFRNVALEKYGQKMWDDWFSVRPEHLECSFPGGEKKSGHLLRMRTFIESFLNAHPDHQKIAVSTHGASLRRLIHNCKNAPQETTPLPNCALYKMFYDLKTAEWIFGQQIV